MFQALILYVAVVLEMHSRIHTQYLVAAQWPAKTVYGIGVKFSTYPVPVIPSAVAHLRSECALQL